MRYLVVLFLIISSCTSGPKKPTLSFSEDSDDWAPPFKDYRAHVDLKPQDLEQQTFKNISLERWRKYTLALKLSETKVTRPQACSLWQSLSEDKTFALARLSKIRRSIICPKLSEAVELNAEESYVYTEALADKAVMDSLRSPGYEDNVDALITKGRISFHYQEREEYFRKAVTIAQKSGSEALISKARAILLKNSPRLNPTPAREELMSAATDFRLWRQFDPALNLYRRVLATSTSSDETYTAMRAIRQTLKTAERRLQYVQATQRIAQWAFKQWKKSPKDISTQKRLHDAQLELARTLWTEDRTGEAVRAILNNEKWLTGIYPMDETYFVRARINEEKKQYDRAILYLDKALGENSSIKGMRFKILWAKAWILYKHDKHQEAVSPLQEIIDNTTETPDKVKALYWLARSYLKLDKASKAEDTFEELIDEDPLGFYGLLAHRELNEEISPLTADESSFDERLSDASIPSNLQEQAILIDWLVAVGEGVLAEKALNRLADQIRKANITDEDVWLKVFTQYAHSGNYTHLFTALTQAKPDIRKSILKSHPEFLFPQPWRSVIEAASTKSGVPSPLIYAIMRQESTFNPKARSPMDAYGLMQLLPSIAKVRASNAKLNYSRPTDLYNPEINVPLGASEIKALLKKYREQFIMAIAAYNANEKALKGWLKVRYRMDPLEFIEEVPYEETRGYLKLVLRNYIFYLRFQSAEPFKFPESCLTLSQDHLRASQSEIN
jgi:soluble lytic murein transglycosylase